MVMRDKFLSKAATLNVALMAMLMTACSNPETTQKVYSDPYDMTVDECYELYPVEGMLRDTDDNAMVDDKRQGEPLAIRCIMIIAKEVGRAPEFWDYYALYRVEGIEPEGLDAMVRALPRNELAVEIRVLHDLLDYLDPIEWEYRWAPNMRSGLPSLRLYCKQYDEVIVELLERAQPATEPDPCLPKRKR